MSINKEVVNHPSHYNKNKNNIEVIDIIEGQDWGEGFNRGNCLKYILRAGIKNPDKEIEDLEKARWYIDREIQRLRAKDKQGFSHEEINELYRKLYKEERLYPYDKEEKFFENGKEIK